MRISVVIPTFNRADLVGETIQSVLDQTYKNYEIVVVDDGSTDSTRQVLDDLIKAQQIRYIYQENSGRSEARNKGMKNSSGDYLMFLDSDDLLLPDALESLYTRAITNEKADLIAGGRIFIDMNGRVMNILDHMRPAKSYSAENVLLDGIRGIFFAPSTYIVRNEMAESFGGFDKTTELAEDFDFLIKCFESGKITFIDKVVVKMRRHQNNTEDHSQREAAILVALKNLGRMTSTEFRGEPEQVRQIKAEWCARIGDDSYALDRNLDALKYYFRTVAVSPRSLLKGRLFRQIIASVIPKFVKQPVRTLVRRKRK